MRRKNQIFSPHRNSLGASEITAGWCPHTLAHTHTHTCTVDCDGDGDCSSGYCSGQLHMAGLLALLPCVAMKKKNNSQKKQQRQQQKKRRRRAASSEKREH